MNKGLQNEVKCYLNPVYACGEKDFEQTLIEKDGNKLKKLLDNKLITGFILGYLIAITLFIMWLLNY